MDELGACASESRTGSPHGTTEWHNLGRGGHRGKETEGAGHTATCAKLTVSKPMASGLYASRLTLSMWQHSASPVSKVRHSRLQQHSTTHPCTDTVLPGHFQRCSREGCKSTVQGIKKAHVLPSVTCRVHLLKGRQAVRIKNRHNPSQMRTGVWPITCRHSAG